MKIDFSSVKNKFKKNKWLILVTIAIWISIIFITLNYYKSSLGYESDGNSNYDLYVELTKDTTITQELTTLDNTKSIALKFATYRRSNKGSINVVVKSKDESKEYVNKTINVSTIQDNAYIVFELNELLSNEDITLTISSDSEEGKAVAVYYSSIDYFENQKCIINNEEQIGDLTTEFLFINEKLSSFCIWIISFAITSLSLVILYLLLFEYKIEIVFSLIVLFFGLVMMIIITPGSAPDDLAHYEASFQVSNYMMFKEHNEVDSYYRNYDSFGDHHNVSHSYTRFVRDILEPIKLTGVMDSCKNDAKDLYKLYYVPQALGITIARLFNSNMLITQYAGRLTNLLFYVVCIYIALKNIPIHKTMVGLIASLPLFVQQASSFSYDSFVNGLTFVIVSYLLKWYLIDEKVKTKDYVIALIANVIIAPAKVVYGLFSLLFWLIPSNRFKSKKDKFIKVLLLSSASIYYVLYNILIRLEMIFGNFLTVKAIDLLNDKYDKIEEVIAENKVWKFKYFVKYPKETLFIYVKTIRYNIKKWFFEAIGKALSGLTLELPSSIFYTLIGLVLCSSIRKEDYYISPIMKIGFVTICLMIAMFTLTAMLIGWLPPEDSMIQGVQGRYFCPLLPYFFSLFGNKKFTLPKQIDKYVILVDIVLIFEVIIYVMSYTFIH